MNVYKVTKIDRTEEIILADYVLLPNGMLVFKNEGSGGKYPTFVKGFASTEWHSFQDITNTPSKKDDDDIPF